MDGEELHIELGETVREPITQRPVPWEQGLIPWGFPTEASLPLFVRPEVMRVVTEHGLTNRRIEVIGLLVGNVYESPSLGSNYAVIESAIPGLHAQGTRTGVSFGNQDWSDFFRIQRREFPGSRIMGWYHTHPDHGVFLSEVDLPNSLQVFKDPWQVALVYDPVRNEASFFGWNHGNIEEIEGFYELSVDEKEKGSAIRNLMIGWEFKKVNVRHSLAGEGISARPAMGKPVDHTAIKSLPPKTGAGERMKESATRRRPVLEGQLSRPEIDRKGRNLERFDRYDDNSHRSKRNIVLIFVALVLVMLCVLWIVMNGVPPFLGGSSQTSVSPK